MLKETFIFQYFLQINFTILAAYFAKCERGLSDVNYSMFKIILSWMWRAIKANETDWRKVIFCANSTLFEFLQDELFSSYQCFKT